jgi:predicted patatin/cPLA2 family phospholipase
MCVFWRVAAAAQMKLVQQRLGCPMASWSRGARWARTMGMRWGATKILSGLLVMSTLLGCGGYRTCTACEAPPGRSGDFKWLEERLARAFSARLNANTMLMLSGGGGYGAWGAGLLNGWTPVRGRPIFDVVTGISTGAIIGTFAFLGQPQDDDTLRMLYTQTTPDDVYRTRPLLWALLFSSSLRDTWPFRDLIKQHVTNQVIDRVAAEGKKQRLFIIGSVDADVGVIRLWDMTEIAMSSDPKRYDRYRRLLLASTAYPVLFPPVSIDHTLHIDGGTREQIFGYVVGNAMSHAYATLSPTLTSKPQAYLIINGQLVVPRQCVAKRIPAIGLRALDIALTEGMIGNLYQIRYLLGMTWDLNLSMIPNEFPIDPNKDSFDQEQSNQIYQRALEWAKTLPWKDGPHFPDGTEESPLPCLQRSNP